MRFELKYFISSEEKSVLLREWKQLVTPDHNHYCYPVASIYYDTTDLKFLEEKEEGFGNKRKVRFRAYGYDFTEITRGTLELKERVCNRVSKRSLSLPFKAIERCLYENDWTDVYGRKGAEPFMLLQQELHLVPSVKISYMRQAFSASCNSFLRITFDSFLSAFQPLHEISDDYHLCPTNLMMPSTQEIMEVKALNTIPEWFFFSVRCHELQQLSISKYSMGIEYLKRRVLL